MIRAPVAILLALALIGGPALCCCSVRATESRSATPKCCCQHDDEPATKPKDAPPPKKHDCPCKQKPATVLALPAADASFQVHLTHADGMPAWAAPLISECLDVGARQDAPALPIRWFADAQEMLRALQVLRL